MKAVGARLPRYDGVAHVTGRTAFVDDVRVHGTLWAKALRSSMHHAGVVRQECGDEGRGRSAPASEDLGRNAVEARHTLARRAAPDFAVRPLGERLC